MGVKQAPPLLGRYGCSRGWDDATRAEAELPISLTMLWVVSYCESIYSTFAVNVWTRWAAQAAIKLFLTGFTQLFSRISDHTMNALLVRVFITKHDLSSNRDLHTDFWQLSRTKAMKNLNSRLSRFTLEFRSVYLGICIGLRQAHMFNAKKII